LDTTRPPFDPAAELQRCAEVLVRHWTLMLPTAAASMIMMLIVVVAVISSVTTLVAALVASDHHQVVAGAGVATAAGIGVLLFGLALIVFAVAIALTLHAAPDVLQDRPPNFEASLHAVMQRLGQFLLLGVICTAFSLALCITLIGIILLPVVGYFLMYAPAAVIIGGEGAVQSMITSSRIARERVPESLVAWVGILIVWMAAMVAHGIAAYIPLVNLIVGFAIGGFTAAYNELVRARFYLALRVPGTVSTLGAPPVRV
jgi:hypothetical protein